MNNPWKDNGLHLNRPVSYWSQKIVDASLFNYSEDKVKAIKDALASADAFRINSPAGYTKMLRLNK